MLVQLMSKYRMREVYKSSMADLSICCYQLENIIEVSPLTASHVIISGCGLLQEFYPALSMHFKAVVRGGEGRKVNRSTAD